MAGNAARPRVVVIDDFAEMRSLISEALGTHGYQVDVAATADQARRLDLGGYDAVLVDASLGPDRGLDLIDAMLTKDPEAGRRCLVMTGGSAGPIPDGIAVLAKPFELPELLAAVSELVALDSPAAEPAGAPGTGAESGARRPAADLPDPPDLPGAEQALAAEHWRWQLLDLTRRLRAYEHRQLTEFLHDGPMQELSAVTLELQMMSRSMPPDPVPRLAEVLRWLDTAVSSLRWLVDGHWPLLVPETQLADALQERVALLVAAPVTVETGGEPAALDSIEKQVAIDIVEFMLHEDFTGQAARAHVTVRNDEQFIQIDLNLSASPDSQLIHDPSAARATVDRLVRALGARAEITFADNHWRARIVLPRRPACGQDVT